MRVAPFLVGIVCITTAIAIAWQTDEGIITTPKVDEVAIQTVAQQPLVVVIPSRKSLDLAAPDPFASPPQKKALAIPITQTPRPPAPTAPPLPYRYIGRVVNQDGVISTFIARDRRIFTAQQNDTLDGQYHVDDVNTDAVVFTYLPLAIRQTLATK
jgi:hypothetical protein